MNDHHFANRISRIQTRLHELSLDAAVLMKPRNMFYITDYNTVIYSRPQYVIVPLRDQPVLVVPKVRENRARRSSRVKNIVTYHEFEVIEERRDPTIVLTATLRNVVSDPVRIGIEADFMPVETHNLLTRNLKGCETVDIATDLRQLRMIKDDSEIANIGKAAALAEVGMDAAVAAIRNGATEIGVNVAAENTMREAWAEGYPGDDIVGFGDDEDGVISALWCWTRSGARIGVSLPASTHEEIPDGEAVLVVIWTTVNGYGAELERTIFKGFPSEERRTAFQAMMTARETLREAVRPGAVCAALVELVGNVMKTSGFTAGPGFIGHGLGLGHHEHPHLVPGETIHLEPGMVLALEPGMLFSRYGVRHSDTVMVTDEGCVALTSWDRFADLET